eukprot:6181093-Pyramimonas_sp.AAC.1
MTDSKHSCVRGASASSSSKPTPVVFDFCLAMFVGARIIWEISAGSDHSGAEARFLKYLSRLVTP